MNRTQKYQIVSFLFRLLVKCQNRTNHLTALAIFMFKQRLLHFHFPNQKDLRLRLLLLLLYPSSILINSLFIHASTLLQLLHNFALKVQEAYFSFILTLVWFSKKALQLFLEKDLRFEKGHHFSGDETFSSSLHLC